MHCIGLVWFGKLSVEVTAASAWHQRPATSIIVGTVVFLLFIYNLIDWMGKINETKNQMALKAFILYKFHVYMYIPVDMMRACICVFIFNDHSVRFVGAIRWLLSNEMCSS